MRIKRERTNWAAADFVVGVIVLPAEDHADTNPLHDSQTIRMTSRIPVSPIMSRDGSHLLQSRIDRFAFHGQNAEDTFVDSSERFFLNEAFQSFNAQGEFTEGQ